MGGARPGDSAELDDSQLVSSVVAFLEANGGVASSRNVGRHLAAQNLLQPMKRSHSGLYHFLQKHDDHFTLVLPTANGALEYQVSLARSRSTPEGQSPEEGHGNSSSEPRALRQRNATHTRPFYPELSLCQGPRHQSAVHVFLQSEL